MMQAELKPRYDSRKSFYGKAVVVWHDDGVVELYSYGAHVVTAHPGGEVELRPKWNETQTTLRHVKEFLRQLGEPALTKAEMEARYV